MESRGYVPPEAETTEIDYAERRNTEAPIPESEIDLRFDRSSGPGGQNVNKVNSKASLKWNVGASSAFSEEEKALIRKYAGNRLKSGDEIHLYSQQERSQLQNKNVVMEMLQDLVRIALIPEKDRIATKPKRSAKERRMDDKSHQGKKKEGRRKVDSNDW